MARKVLLMLTSLLLSLAVLEFGARVWLTRFASEQDFLKYASVDQIMDKGILPKFVPHRYLGYIPTPNYSKDQNKHNSLGFRGEEIVQEKPDGVFRIACLGGSTTYGNKVGAPVESYPGRLQEYLRSRGYRVEVINGGCPGYSSLESLINLQLRILPLSPDLVLVYHGGINDVHPRLVWPPTAYQRDNSGYLGSIAIPRMPSILEFTILGRIVLIDRGRVLPDSSMQRVLGRWPETAYSMEFWRQMRMGRYPDGVFKQVKVAQMLEANKPSHLLWNLRDIYQVSRGVGASVVLMTWAFSPSALTGDDPRLESDEYQSAIAEQNNVIRGFANSEQIPLLDLARKEIPDGYYDDGSHFNLEGNRFRGRVVGEFVLENFTSELPASSRQE